MNVYEIQTAISLGVLFSVSPGGVPADPVTVTLYVEDPTNGITPYVYGSSSIVRDDVGRYHFIITPSISGTWTYKWQGVGNVIATSPDTQFKVNPSALIPG